MKQLAGNHLYTCGSAAIEMHNKTSSARHLQLINELVNNVRRVM